MTPHPFRCCDTPLHFTYPWLICQASCSDNSLRLPMAAHGSLGVIESTPDGDRARRRRIAFRRQRRIKDCAQKTEHDEEGSRSGETVEGGCAQRRIKDCAQKTEHAEGSRLGEAVEGGCVHMRVYVKEGARETVAFAWGALSFSSFFLSLSPHLAPSVSVSLFLQNFPLSIFLSPAFSSSVLLSPSLPLALPLSLCPVSRSLSLSSSLFLSLPLSFYPSLHLSLSLSLCLCLSQYKGISLSRYLPTQLTRLGERVAPVMHDREVIVR